MLHWKQWFAMDDGIDSYFVFCSVYFYILPKVSTISTFTFYNQENKIDLKTRNKFFWVCS